MIATIEHNNESFKVDLSKPVDISIPMSSTEETAKAWYVDQIKIEPVVGDGFVGEVKEGGSVNFKTITFNPHGNGTHTECVGHITPEFHSINQLVKQFFFKAQLISVEPTLINGDLVITKESLQHKLKKGVEALVLRTLPNDLEKLKKNYSNSNPPYMDAEAMKLIVNSGIEHLLIDLPSVDKEVDNGALTAHRIFWNYPENTQYQRSITEFIYVDNKVIDGNYLLNLQFASFENDASPSKPLLYKIL